MIHNRIQKISLGLALAGLLTMISCVEDPTEDLRTADQLFRPILFTAGVNGSSVSFSWVPIKGASYSLEVSRDSMHFERELQSFPLDSTANYLVEDLWSQSIYSARIKAVSKDPAVKDSEYQTILFVTGTENIFFGVSSSAILSDRVGLSWDSSKVVTKIKIFAANTELSTVELTEAEKLGASRVITGLKPATPYTFRIYNGEMLRGTTTVTTKAGS